jgi:hypothetical protein
MTVLTFGVWLIAALSSAAKRILWPWTCEHCGWHEPDFRSPADRLAHSSKPRGTAGESGAWLPEKGGALHPRSSSDATPADLPEASESQRGDN